jgi:hypothetical protein
MTHANLIATAGRTPLVELRRLAKDLPGRILAKLEMRNPRRVLNRVREARPGEEAVAHYTSAMLNTFSSVRIGSWPGDGSYS